MKKIMVCMLLLLPLIIVFSVLIAIDVISVQAYIAVEGVDIVLNENPVSGTAMEVDLDKLELEFKGATYPLNAKNSGFTWEIIDSEAEGGEDLTVATVDTNGKVTLHNFGRCRLKITSNSEAKTAYVDLIVVGYELKSVSLALTEISDNKLTLSDSSDIILGERRFVTPVFSPATAKINAVSYSSLNESVAVVDANGILTAKGIGKTEITLRVNDSLETKLNVNVISGRFDRTVYYSSASFDLIEAGFTGFSGDRIVTGNASINTDQGIINLIPCLSSEIYIPDMLYSNFSLKVGGLPLYLKASYKAFERADETPSVAWRSSDESRGEIDGSGKITAKKSGQVVFSATAGSSNADIEIKIVEPVRTIVLNTVDIQKGGIENIRLFGDETINEENERVPFSYDVKVLYPANLSSDNFEYYTDSEKAYFENGSSLLNVRNIEKKTVIKVTVKAKNPYYDVVPVVASFNITVNKGVNVISQRGINYVIVDELEREVGSDFYLQSNIEVNQTIELYQNFFGNGFILDASKWNKKSDTIILHILKSGVKLQNVRIISDFAERIEISNGLRGYGVVVGDAKSERLSDVEINYCIIENAYFLLDLNKCDINIEGSVLRNCSNFGIRILSNYIEDALDPYNYSNLKLNNVVMSNIVAPAVGLTTESFEKNDRANGPLTKQSSVTSTGFLDIYNWQDIVDAKMIDRELIPGNEQLNSALQSLIKSSLKTQLNKSMYDNVRVRAADGTMYLHLGIISAGGLCPTTSEVSIEDKNYLNKFDLFDLDDPTLRKALSGIDKCYLWLYRSDAEIQPEDEVEYNKELYNQLINGR